MIRIIVDNDVDAAALKDTIEYGPGLPEVFYRSGYLIQQESDGSLRSVAGGGTANTVFVTAEGGVSIGGGGGGGSTTVEGNPEQIDWEAGE